MIHTIFRQYICFFFYNLLTIYNLSILVSQRLSMNFFNTLRFILIRYYHGNEYQKKLLFDHHFFKYRYYLHKSASEVHMANILNISSKTLNDITLKNYNLNFNELCEKFRFEHFWTEFTNPLNLNLPINSIIDASGFPSTTDFTSLMSNYKEESKHIITKNYV